MKKWYNYFVSTDSTVKVLQALILQPPDRPEPLEGK